MPSTATPWCNFRGEAVTRASVGGARRLSRHTRDAPTPEYDVERAKALLAEAGIRTA